MLRPQRHRFRKAGAKGSGRSVRNPVNQVQAEVLETRRARQLHGRRNRGGIMNAPQPPQRGIVERLRANRKPVHPRPRNRAAFAAVNVPGFASHVHSVTADNRTRA